MLKDDEKLKPEGPNSDSYESFIICKFIRNRLCHFGDSPKEFLENFKNLEDFWVKFMRIVAGGNLALLMINYNIAKIREFNVINAYWA